jgi:hypothetical protein
MLPLLRRYINAHRRATVRRFVHLLVLLALLASAMPVPATAAVLIPPLAPLQEKEEHPPQ